MIYTGPWPKRVLLWARMQSQDLHAALLAATKARDAPISHDCGDESIFFLAHLEDWMTASEALGIGKHVRDIDGVEAFCQLSCRFDFPTVLTKSYRLKSIQKFLEKSVSCEVRGHASQIR